MRTIPTKRTILKRSQLLFFSWIQFLKEIDYLLFELSRLSLLSSISKLFFSTNSNLQYIFKNADNTDKADNPDIIPNTKQILCKIISE